MAWIESHQALREHPKTKKLARLLGVPRIHVVGHLHGLWWWALEYADSGDLSGVDVPEIADAAEWDGDAAQFVAALEQAGFIDANGEGRRVLHDWEAYAGRLLERRRQHGERAARNRQLYGDLEVVRSVRDRDGDTCRYCGITVDWANRKGANGGTYDHLDPEGSNSVDNVVVACRGCNARKGRRTPAQAGMPLLPSMPGRLSTRNLPAISRNGRFNSTVPLPEPQPSPETATADAVAEPAAAPLTGVSEEAAAILQAWREAHGKKAVPKLNPTQRAKLEAAVLDLGPDRLREAVQYSAAKGLPNFHQAVACAYTKRLKDEDAPAGALPPVRRNGGGNSAYDPRPKPPSDPKDYLTGKLGHLIRH